MRWRGSYGELTVLFVKAPCSSGGSSALVVVVKGVKGVKGFGVVKWLGDGFKFEETGRPFYGRRPGQDRALRAQTSHLGLLDWPLDLVNSGAETQDSSPRRSRITHLSHAALCRRLATVVG